jgi:SRSO17 transposase
MLVNIPPSLEEFCRMFGSGPTKAQKRLLPMLLSGLLLVRGKRSQAALGRAVKRQRRHRSSLSRLFRRARFRTRDVCKAVSRKLMDIVKPTHKGARRTWVLLIDGTCTKRGGFTKIANALKYKRKKKKKGRSTKAHSFVMGLLITERGVRIPVARRTFYTKAYSRKHRKKYRSQQALAGIMIRELHLPEDVDLIVMADEYFEGESLWKVCSELGHTWIVPVDSRRCFSDRHGRRRAGRRLHARGKALSRTAYEEVVLVRGQEKTVSYRRYWSRRTGPKDKRRYRVAREIRSVTKLGKAQVVYSWKSPVYRPRRSERGETFKVLLTNNLEMTGAEVVEWYELRWQIELYFRELKSYVGLSDYSGQDFQAFERHVDMVMLAFSSQEWRRMCLLNAKPAPKIESQLKTARTSFMQQLLEREAEERDLEYFRNCLATEQGRRELLYLFPALRAAS